MANFCYKPFDEIEIYSNGDVYTCCPFYLPKGFFIGNIFRASSFDDIWYSPNAILLREKILNEDFSLCNTMICNKQYLYDSTYVLNPPYPRFVRFSYDDMCNVFCRYCRNKPGYCVNYKNFENEEIFKKIFIPLLKNALFVSVSTVGEITASKHSQDLIKKIIILNDKIKFDLLTNGLLFDEVFYNRLALENRIKKIEITLSAATEKTYNNIVRGSDFNRVLKNVEFISNEKKQGNIGELYLCFVVNRENYMEIPDFIELSLKYDCVAMFWELRNNNSDLCSNYLAQSVWCENNSEYDKFVDIIKFVRKNYPESSYIMPNLFTSLKSHSLLKKITRKLSLISIK